MAAYIAVHSYSALNQDELSMKLGQRVHVLEQPSGGWWRGQVTVDSTGAMEDGWFPSNYVTLQTSQMMGDGTAYRGFVVDQLMQFEQAYAETLAGFEHRHLNALLAASWLTDHDKGMLLRPLGQLIKLQQQYHHDLEEQLDGNNKEQTCVGKVCLKHGMEMYWQHTRYAGTFAQAKARLEDLERTHRDYQSYMQTHPTPPSLNTALSLPLSTSAKRSTLLRNLLDRTPSHHPDRPLLKVASAAYEQLVQAGEAVVFMRQSHLTLQASPVTHWNGPSLLELGLPRLTCKVAAGPLQLNGRFDPATAVPALMLLFDERLVAVVQVVDRPGVEAAVHYELFASKNLWDIKVLQADDDTLLVTPNLPKGRMAQSAFFADMGSFGLVFATDSTASTWCQAIFGLQTHTLLAPVNSQINLNPYTNSSQDTGYVHASTPQTSPRRRSTMASGGKVKSLHTKTKSFDMNLDADGGSMHSVVTEYDVVAAFAKTAPIVPNRPVAPSLSPLQTEPSSALPKKPQSPRRRKKSSKKHGGASSELATLQVQVAKLQTQLAALSPP